MRKKKAEKETGLIYRNRTLTRSEKLRLAGEALLLIFLIDYLFYEKWEALLFLSPVSIFYVKYRKKQLIDRQLKKLNYDFREVLDSLSIALRAGYSPENAFREAEKNVRTTLGDSDMLRELHHINTQTELNVPPDRLLQDLADRTGLEDIRNFSAVFSTVRLQGGSMVETVRSAADMITDKIDVEKEIMTNIAGKRTEQAIMTVMPCAIILYMRLASPGFLDVLYETAFGTVIMTLCLAAYAGAFYLGRRIVDIDL